MVVWTALDQFHGVNCGAVRTSYSHLTPVKISLGALPNSSSLRTTGYLPAFVGSTKPTAAILAEIVFLGDSQDGCATVVGAKHALAAPDADSVKPSMPGKRGDATKAVSLWQGVCEIMKWVPQRHVY